ncbi:hypothetical protein [Haloterrigena turkmenica]|uniref:hypothetical protein n=1 Tax=Haloterrigena turkmenica TaxID=62320 RepID=UPI00067831B2|nr:hypothetical protein [Haloterrigena turkmenica]
MVELEVPHRRREAGPPHGIDRVGRADVVEDDSAGIRVRSVRRIGRIGTAVGRVPADLESGNRVEEGGIDIARVPVDVSRRRLRDRHRFGLGDRFPRQAVLEEVRRAIEAESEGDRHIGPVDPARCDVGDEVRVPRQREIGDRPRNRRRRIAVSGDLEGVLALGDGDRTVPSGDPRQREHTVGLPPVERRLEGAERQFVDRVDDTDTRVAGRAVRRDRPERGGDAGSRDRRQHAAARRPPRLLVSGHVTRGRTSSSY